LQGAGQQYCCLLQASTLIRLQQHLRQPDVTNQQVVAAALGVISQRIKLVSHWHAHHQSTQSGQ
jgi:hypothetical protein